VVIHDGRVADEGTLEELVERSPIFLALFAEQLAAAGIRRARAGDNLGVMRPPVA
jgi:hypothetical protein